MSDYQLGDTIYHKFTSRAFATGVPTVLAGTPVVSIYEDDSVTQITAGITLTISFDSVVGLNHLTIVATGGNGFETGKFYQAVITTGTVGGVSVVGETVWTFSLEASAAALDLANGTDGLGAIKTDTAATLVDTAEIGAAGAGLTALATQASVNTVDSNVDAILVDTGTTLPASLGVIDDNVNTILVDTSTTIPAQITALNDFDPATDAVANVTLVATTTTNSDMRGTDNAATAASLATAQLDLDTITGTDGATISSASSASLVDDVWDEVLTAGSHNVNNSSGRRLRELEIGSILHADDTTAGSTTSVVSLAAAASGIDDFYLHQVFIIDGEARLIVGYDGTAKDVTLDKALLNGAPSNNTAYEISTLGPVYSAAQRLEYTDDNVFINTLTGAAGTVQEINGIQDNPSSNLADATTIAGAHSPAITSLNVAPGSSITLAGTYTNFQFLGRAATIAFGGQQLPNCTFERHFVSGVVSASTASQYRLIASQVTSAGITTPMDALHATVTYLGDITFNAVGTFTAVDCVTDGETVDMGVALATGLARFVRHSGDLVIDNLTSSQVLEVFGTGQVTLNASCTGGTFQCGGDVKVVNNGSTVVTGLTLADIDINVIDIQGATFDTATDSLEAIRNRGDAAWTTGAGGTPPDLLVSTTIATLASQVSFTLTAASADDDAYNGQIAIITDASTAVQKAVATVSDYVGSTRTVTLSADPAIFTMATTDIIEIVAATGAGGSSITEQQVRDAMKLAPSGGAPAAGSVDEHLDDILTDTGTTLPASLTTIDANVDSVLVDTGTTIPAQITALNDLSAAQVNAEVDTALADYDGPTNAEMNARTILAGDYFDPATDAVANVTLVATTTTNTDMRGTDSAAQAGDAMALTAGERTTLTATITGTALTESYRADGATGSLAQMMYETIGHLGESSIAGTTKTIKEVDGSTTAETFTLDDATNPTSITRAT